MKRIILIFIELIINNVIFLFPDSLKLRKIIWEKENDPSFIFSDSVSMIVDNQGYIYLMDMKEGSIRKYDKNGKFLLKFGKRGRGPGEFSYLALPTTIIDNNIYIWGMINTNIYTTDGKLLKSYSSDPSLSRPVFLKSGGFVCNRRDIDESLKKIYIQNLEYYSSNKAKRKIVTSLNYQYYLSINHSLVSKSVFVWPTFAEKILFAVDSTDRIIYCLSNKPDIFAYDESKTEKIISLSPILKSFSKSDIMNIKSVIKNYEENINKESSIKRYFPIPEHWQYIYNLLVDERDNIWINIKELNRTGLLKYNREGKFIKFYKIDIITSAIKNMFKYQLYIKRNTLFYFLYDDDNGVELYTADLM